MNRPPLLVRPAFVPEFSDYQAFRGTAIGLTGQRGILGGILRERLARHGIECVAYQGDVNDPDALGEWFAARQFRHFFHFAALVPLTAVEADPLRAYQTNVIGIFNVCRQLVLTQRDCWLFHCSSSHVYEPTASPVPIAEDARTVPQSFYGNTKLDAERVVATLLGKLRIPYCIGRVFSFTDPKQTPPYLVPSLRERIDALRDGDTLQVDNPEAVRDIQGADYVIDAILHLARVAARDTVNIGTGSGTSVRDIALAVARESGKHITVSGGEQSAGGSLIADTTRLRALLSAPGGT